MHAVLTASTKNSKLCRRYGIAENSHTLVILDLNSMPTSVSTMLRSSGVICEKIFMSLSVLGLLLPFTQQMLPKLLIPS